ncbi:MAG: hypothetical protein H7836_17045, partial [Magnetococcus sp. YQC-3]
MVFRFKRPAARFRRRRPMMRRRKTYKKSIALPRLQRQVARLTRTVRASGPHNVNLFFNGSLELNSNYSVVPLSDFNSIYNNTMGSYIGGASSGQCFGYAQSDWNNSNQAFLKSISIQWQLDSANEEDNINYSMFLINIAKNGDTIYNSSTGALGALTQPLHYLNQNGMAMLNKKYFNILRQKFGTLGNYGTALTAQGAQGQTLITLDQGYWKLKPRRTIKNPAGNFHTLSASP